MPGKRVMLAIAGAALLFGAIISGCNRNRDAGTAAGARRPVKGAIGHGSALAQATPVRPAEVLAAAVKRPRYRGGPVAPNAGPYRSIPVPSRADYEMTRAYAPLPEPAPASGMYNQAGVSEVYTLSDTGVRLYQVPEYAPPSGAYIPPSFTVYEPPRMVHPSPELAMARAMLPPAPAPAPIYAQPATFVPPIEPQLFHAPIPELEPVRYQRVAQRPVASPPPLVSGQVQRLPQFVPAAAPVNASYQASRALAPLAQSPAAAQGWVPSPVTAMGGAGF